MCGLPPTLPVRQNDGHAERGRAQGRLGRWHGKKFRGLHLRGAAPASTLALLLQTAKWQVNVQLPDALIVRLQSDVSWPVTKLKHVWFAGTGLTPAV
jgi:hypothetical protein